jgi:uncharacterized protein with HEPN domain
MNERDEARLRDMLDAAHKARSYVKGQSRTSLEANDEILGFAVVRAIEIIGEAASRVSSETRASLPQIEWGNIIGMRNRIIHDYLNVDYDIVWKVATQSLVSLVEELEKLLLSD